MGETGIRLVLQRLAPSAANLARLSELIAANAQDERCELMWGSPGTILAGRELGLDVTASVEWLRSARDPDGLWTQQLYGHTRRFLGPVHGFAGCALALGEPAGVSETLRAPGGRGGRPRQLVRPRWAAARRSRRRTDSHPVLPRRAGDRRDARTLPRRGPRRRGRRADVACRAAAQGRKPLPRDGRERLRVPGARRANRRRTVARASAHVRDARSRPGRAEPVGVRPGPLFALDGRPGNGALSGGLHRRSEAGCPCR